MFGVKVIGEEKPLNLAFGAAIPRSKEEDIVDSKFKIQIHHPIAEISNDFVKYFLATHIDTNQEFFAVVFERSFNPDLELINYIGSFPEKLFIKPIAISLTKLSINKSVVLALITEKFDYTNTLTAYIEQHGPLSLRYIYSTLIPFLAKIIEFFGNNETNCGNINPSNILVTEEGLLLREPYIAYPHYYQENAYLALELLNTSPEGRKIEGIAADIYAVGVTALESFLGAKNWNQIEKDLQQSRFNSSSFEALVGKTKLADEIKVLVKGCLNDNISDRWRPNILIEWTNGKISAVKYSSLQESGEQVVPISFNGTSTNNLRAFADRLYNNWESALNFINEDRFIKWLQRSSSKSKALENVETLISGHTNVSSFLENSVDKNERAQKILMALDYQGPLRSNLFSLHLAALPNMLFASIVSKQKRNVIEGLIKLILRKSWEELPKFNPKFNIGGEVLQHYEEVVHFFNNQIPGCGIERVLYSLNPTAPCLSPLVGGEYILNIAELLPILNKKALESPEKLVFDRHLISFITQKLELKREAFVKMVKDFPKLSDDSLIYGIVAVILAIQKEPEVEVPNLIAFLGKEIIKIYDNILHNIRLKKILADKINKAVSEANLNEILRLISNPKIYQNDYNGYYKACRDVNTVNHKIEALANNRKVSDFGRLFGQRITVLVSYLLFIVITLGMVM